MTSLTTAGSVLLQELAGAPADRPVPPARRVAGGGPLYVGIDRRALDALRRINSKTRQVLTASQAVAPAGSRPQRG